MDELKLVMNKDGVFELYKEPYVTIEVPTEEDYSWLREAGRYKETYRWIPVSERLPDKEFWEHHKQFEDEDLEVQVMIKGAKRPTTLLYNAEGEFYEMHGDGATFYIVTHWAPLMEPPKEAI